MYRIVGVDGRQYGPVGADEIRRWLSENRLNAQTLVQAEGAPGWKPLSAFPELVPAAGTVPPTMPPAPTVASRAGAKIPAGVCGILLGGFGVHKFILGYTGAGLILLLLTVLSCFLLAPVTHLIGLIEGIIYLCKPDDEFVRTYVDGRKEWF